MSEKSTSSTRLSRAGKVKARLDALMAVTPFWQGALAASLLTVLILSTIPIAGPAPVTGWDKLNHFIAFTELAALARLGWPARSRIGTGLAILGFGLLIELIQATLPYRSCSIADLMADGIGILAGLAALRIMRPDRNSEL